MELKWWILAYRNGKRHAPFNWTQDDDKNGAVKIEGTNQYANSYDVQIIKQVIKALSKEAFSGQNFLEWFDSCIDIRKSGHDCSWYESNIERKKKLLFQRVIIPVSQ